ncbi:Rv1733c family protein [Jidongwangia harbinensis]|uniref:Rv1733c family protein n=1 Tax=Jidongwangia harbinensis TaxID=2878561 RepID=UPI001CD9FBAF|nr:hypothetical protein [Jidongwangia harbinensis]MCA2211458.1 hypothetical protein [Jidongwangia harbinensis]
MCSRRIASRMPWNRNPLRRGSDTVQAWLTLVVVLATLIVAPWLAGHVAHTTYRSGMRAMAWEEQHHRPVTAVLLEDAPDLVPGGAEAPPGPDTVSVPARWTGADGTVRTGSVPAAGGTPAGDAVTVWVDDRGTVVRPPVRRSPTLDAWVAATMAALTLVAALVVTRRILVWRLDRRRLRSWETEWLVVGPRWSRR